MPSEDEVDEAIRKMRAVLDRPDTPREMRLKAALDQRGAALRDMTPDEREAVARSLVVLEGEGDNPMTLEEARDWIRRLVNESDQ